MLQGKVALEEHVVLPALQTVGSPRDVNDPEYYADVRKRLADAEQRIADMDRFGIQTMVLSLSQPGVQGIPERAAAVDAAQRLNDEMAEFVNRRPDRFSAFASVAVQDPRAA